MLKGIHLTLMVGPVIPVPVPQVVTDALIEATVETDEDNATFQMSFDLGKRSVLETVFLLAGEVPVPLRALLIATVNGLPEVLIDGLILHHEVAPGANGGASVMTITGTDLTAAMDLEEFTGLPYPAMPIEARVALIVAKYAIFSLIPLVIPVPLTDVPLPIERIPVHWGTDLDYVRGLARDVGYTFHILSPAPLVNLAYFGPKLRIGVPQSAVNIDMDAETNLDDISFKFDNRDRVQPAIIVPIPDTTLFLPVPIPDISLLSPPLGLIQPIPANLEYLEDVTSLSPIEATMRGLAAVSDSSDCVTATGSLDVIRYGGTLKARNLVGVRGGGLAFDGLYFVKKVRSTLRRGEFKQSFDLVRNGIVSTVPLVPA